MCTRSCKQSCSIDFGTMNSADGTHQFTSPYARAIDVAGERKLSELFFDEARRHLDREEGKASVPTVQALCVMFLYCMGVGKDRLGQIYRYACCEMYKRMRAGTKFPKDIVSTATSSKHRQLFSRFSWGVVHFETYVLPATISLLNISSLTYCADTFHLPIPSQRCSTYRRYHVSLPMMYLHHPSSIGPGRLALLESSRRNVKAQSCLRRLQQHRLQAQALRKTYLPG
jgi:hypothetical protein